MFGGSAVVRGDCGSEEAEDGTGEGRLPHHFTERNRYTSQRPPSQHCARQGESLLYVRETRERGWKVRNIVEGRER